MSFNPHQWYLNGLSTYGGPPNTFIGGVAGVISTPDLLAAKFENYPSGTSINVSKIYNFTITGSDISCYIGIDYQLLQNAFWGVPSITYYRDMGNRLRNIPGNDTFYQSKPNLTELYLPALVDKFGPTQGRDSSFITSIASNGTITIPIFFQTSNAGAEEGDVAFLRSLGWTVIYV